MIIKTCNVNKLLVIDHFTCTFKLQNYLQDLARKTYIFIAVSLSYFTRTTFSLHLTRKENCTVIYSSDQNL